MPHHTAAGVAMRLVAIVAAASVIVACAGGASGPTNRTSSSTRPTTTAPARAEISDERLTTPDGRTRTYRVVVPASAADAGPAPLVVALHGGTGSGVQFQANSGFDDLAAKHGFVVVYPDGTEIGGSGVLARGHVWNGGRCCGPAASDEVDDVGFVRRVIDRVQHDHRIDPRRVYAVGHSNGAIMSYRLACELADRIVGIGIQAGSIEIDGCAPTQPVSVFAIHGTADTSLPIAGGAGSGISGATFSSPVHAIAEFARTDDCSRSTTTVDADNPDLTTERWDGCARGTAVHFVRVTNGTHPWMGHPNPRAALGPADAPYENLDSSAAIWQFLAAHPRR